MARRKLYPKDPDILPGFPRLGRPRMRRLERRSRQIVVRLNPLQFAFLEEQAGEEVTVSDVIRAMVDRAMKRKK